MPGETGHNTSQNLQKPPSLKAVAALPKALKSCPRFAGPVPIWANAISYSFRDSNVLPGPNLFITSRLLH
uniref:Uncharacterized protein n=1 Tax=Macrostomum lignano TaxID=282301 RepID=A0A1I8G4X9_9PLAT